MSWARASSLDLGIGLLGVLADRQVASLKLPEEASYDWRFEIHALLIVPSSACRFRTLFARQRGSFIVDSERGAIGLEGWSRPGS